MNINIELTQMQEHYLKLFAKNQYPGAKDNLSTKKPIHAVQTQRERVADDEFDHDKIVFVVPDWEYIDFEKDTLHELVKEYYDHEHEDCPIPIVTYSEAYNTTDFEDINNNKIYVHDEESYLDAYSIPSDLWERRAVEYYYEDVAYFYTLQSARNYMNYQAHNLNNPRTYTKSGGYSNFGEYEHFWDLLMSMGTKLNESEDK